MSTFEGHAKSLAELYVFYQRLHDDHPLMAKYVNNAGYRILRQTKKYKSNSEKVRQQAQAEFSKEKQLLAQHFGLNLNFDYYNGELGARTGFKEIIDALNATLNLKDIYERNIQLIKETTGQKAVYSFYPTYFMKAWSEYWPTVKKEAEQLIKNGNEPTFALEQILDKYLSDICVLGIIKMLDGPELESSRIDPDLKNAYRALVDQIGKVEQIGTMANQIYNAYQLDELKQGLMTALSPKTKKIDGRTLHGKAKTMVSKNLHSRGGLSQEAIETAVFSIVADELSKSPNVSVESGVVHSGSKQIKADNIITIGVDLGMIEDAIVQAGENRSKNIEALSNLGNKLKNLDSGFIIYSSDKNYTLNKNFSGFHAGSLGATAQDFLNNVYKNSSSLNTLVGAIQQLGKGAILQDREGDFEELLAQDVAYMLFDDYSTIGQKNEGGNAIHVMNLNGVLIPMSVILTLLADAIDSIESDSEAIRRIVNVDIKAPEVLYKTNQQQIEAFPQNPHGAWEYQRQHALDNTKISVTFLRNFKSLISQYL